ncbi:alkaline phosphatase isoform X1 [Tetranychus urticae]|uniref:alkaline phosphatase isoform X1 n=1 Tax=Tetranychus urticae TaxID=32264 RepID=UPI00077BA64E|nr:alkaline phosphatase isoform X1 [Tetranychus urticae]
MFHPIIWLLLSIVAPFGLAHGTPLTTLTSLSSSSSNSIDLTNVFDKCLSIHEQVTLSSQIQLSPLLSCDRDLFKVVLDNTRITGLNKYLITPFKRVNKDKYEATMSIEGIKVESNYHINGPVAHMFPVSGEGTLEMDYVNITIDLGVKKSSESDNLVNIYAEKIDFHNHGYEVINGKQTVDNKADHLDKGFQESLGKVIFWQIFKALKVDPSFNVSVKCLEDSIQSDQLLNTLSYNDLPRNNVHHASEIVAMKSHHSSVYSVESHSRAKRDVSPQLPNIPEIETTEAHWYKKAQESLDATMNIKKLNKNAKNVILFIGDGMGISTLSAARVLKEQLNGLPGGSNRLFFEEFPQSALIKTFNLDRQTPDSAGTATAFTCGIKANYATLGVSGRIFKSEKDCSVIAANAVPSIFTWAQAAGKGTGIVTTTRITHATPAAGYAHVSNRDWESDTDVAKFGASCKDIARQLVEDAPGNKLNVIMGGGWKHFAGSNVSDPTPSAGAAGGRTDGVNLIDRWISDREARSANWSFVTSTKDLRSVDTAKTDYLFGLFNRDHLPYELERNKSPEGSPSLAEMVESAVNVLSKHDNGFVLLVEGGLVDIAHHDNYARLSLHEVLGLEAAIQKATELLPLDETLIIVTADHSHGFVMNGYPLRGNDIFGVSDTKEDGVNKTFSTLMYTTGPGHVEPRPDEAKVTSRDNPRYRFYSAINLSSAVHGGEDVALYSVGPMSHLFNGLQDQSYIAHVIAYSSCIGEYASTERCKNQLKSAAPGNKNNLSILVYFILTVLLFVYNSRLSML